MTAASCESATCEGVPAPERARQICSAAPPPSQSPDTGRCGSRTAEADSSAVRPRAASGADVTVPHSEGAPSRRERPPPPPRTAKPGPAATATVDAIATERLLLSQVVNSPQHQTQKQLQARQLQQKQQLQQQQQQPQQQLQPQQQPQRQQTPPSAPLQAVLQRIRYFEAPREQTCGLPNAPLSQPLNVAHLRPSSLALSSKAASPSPTASAAPLTSFYRPPAVAAALRCSGKACSAGEASAAVRSEAECEVVRFAALRNCFEKSRWSCGPQADDEDQRPKDRLGGGDRPNALSRISPCYGVAGESCNVRPRERSFVEALGDRATGSRSDLGEQRQQPLSSECAAAVGSGGASCCCSASSSYVGGESVDGDLDASADFPGASVSSSSSVTSDDESLMAVSDFAGRVPVDRRGPIDEEDSMPSCLNGGTPLIAGATLGGCGKAVEGPRRRGNDGHDFDNAVAAAAAEDDEDDEGEARDGCGGGDGGLDLDVNSASCGYFYDDEFETLADDFSGHCCESGMPREATANANGTARDVGRYDSVTGDADDGGDDDDPLRGYASAFENVLQVITSSGCSDSSSSTQSSNGSCGKYEADDDETSARRLCAAAEAAVSPDNYTLAFGAAAAALSGSSATLEHAFGSCCDGSRAAAAVCCCSLQRPHAAAATAPGTDAVADTTVAATPRSARDHLRREALTRLHHRVAKCEPPKKSEAAARVRRPPPPLPPRLQRTATTKREADRALEDATRHHQEGRISSEMVRRRRGAGSGDCCGFLPNEQSPSVGCATPRRCCVSLTDITVPPPPPSPPPPSPPPPPPPSAQRVRSTSPRCCHYCQSVASAERPRQSDCGSGGTRQPDGRAGSCRCRRDAIASELTAASEPLQREQQRRQRASENRRSLRCSGDRQALPDVTFLRRDKQLLCSTVWWASLSEEPTFCRAASDSPHRQFTGVDARGGGATPPLASPMCTYAVVYQSSIASERKYQMALVRRLLGDDRDGGDLASPGAGCCRADSSSGIATGSSEVAAAAIKDPQAGHHRTSPDGCHRRRSSDSPHVEMKGFLAGYASDERFPGVSRFADAIDELLTLTQTRLTSEQETETRLVEALRELSLALESALSAGIRACRVTVLAFGKFASRADVWDVVEDSTASVSGDPARPFGTVIAQVKRMDAALPANLRFCMFVCGLLNHRCLDFWLQLLRHNQSLLDKYYDDASLLRFATDEHRTVYTALLAAAARLSLCSFDFDLESLMHRLVEHSGRNSGYRCFFRQEDEQVQQQPPSAQFYV